MRAIVFLISLLSVTPAHAAIAHQEVPALSLLHADTKAFSLESIHLIQAAQEASGNCDVGDNPMICPATGPIRGLVQVAVSYMNDSGESVTLLFNLPTSNFTQAQLREIAAGALADQFVNLSVKEVRKSVRVADERCSFGEAPASMTCEAPGRTTSRSLTVFDLAVSAR